MNPIARNLSHELRAHAPFTLGGTVLGVAFMAAIVYFKLDRAVSLTLFEISHPGHVLMSAITTAAMYRLHVRKPSFLATLLIGYFGSIGIATLSDCVIPFIGEWLLKLPHSHIHLGFIEEWYIVNPIAIVGILIAMAWPHTKLSHGGHVLLSIFASLFHMSMALGDELSIATIVLTPIFLFLAVWIPCCTSDIVFPLLFVKDHTIPHHCAACDTVAGETERQAEKG